MNKENYDNWLDDKISEIINTKRPVFDAEGFKQKFPDEMRVLEERFSQKSKVPKINIWRKIMTSKKTKYAAAAIIIITAVVGLAELNDTNEPPTQQIVQIVDEEQSQVEQTNAQAETTEPAVGESQFQQIKDLYAASDVDQLVKFLVDADYETKLMAADYIASFGDDQSLAVLQILSSQYTGELADPYALAISQVISGDEKVQATSTQTATDAQTAAAVFVGDDLLKIIPQESMFCLLINNYDYTISMVDQYISGISPMPVGLAMLARMQLAGILGDPQLKGVNTAGSFGVFGLYMPKDEQAGVNPENIFLAGLIPFSDFEMYITDNPGYTKPDANGISVVKSKTMSGKDTSWLLVKLGKYALISSSGKYAELKAAVQLIGSSDAGLTGSLDAEQLQAAKNEPIWAYGNVKLASETFNPLITEQVDKIRAELEKSKASQQEAPQAAILNMYVGMLEILTKEIDSLSIKINPKPSVINLTATVTAVANTNMARMFTADSSSTSAAKYAGYLQDDALVNIALKTNTPFLKETCLTNLDMLLFLDEDMDVVSEEAVAKMQTLVAEMINNFAGAGVVSVASTGRDDSLYNGWFVLEVKDVDEWKRIHEQMNDLWNNGGLANLYLKMGIKSRFEVEYKTDTYGDVSIDSTRFEMSPTDPNSQYGQAIKTVYQGGINYRSAVIDNLVICVADTEPNETIYKLIDRVKAQNPSQYSGSMNEALSVLSSPSDADVIGTFNVVNYLKMIMAMGQMFGNQQMPSFDYDTQTNIAFSVKVGDGKEILEIAVPKDHIMEIKTASEMLQQNMMATQSTMMAANEIGATDIQLDTTVDPNELPDEKEIKAIEGLRAFSELTGGKYPDSLNVYDAVREAGQAYMQNRALDPNADPNASPSEEDLRSVVAIQDTCLFFAQLQSKYPGYNEEVTTEFPDAVLLRWQIDPNNFRIIYGDLTTEDVNVAELNRLENMPLNRQPIAIKPHPADGAMAGSLENIKLEWMPGMYVNEYHLYFGNSGDDLTFITEISEPICMSPGMLETDSTYYWRIDEVQSDGSIAAGQTWSFKTGKQLAVWSFDQVDGNAVLDSSGKNNAAIFGSPIWQGDAGKIGGALEFYDANDCLRHDVAMNPSGGTISHWVKLDNTDHRMIIYYEANGEGQVWDGWQHQAGEGIEICTGIQTDLGGGGEPYWYFAYQNGSNSIELIAETPIAQVWTHYVATWDTKGDAVLYIDGKEVASREMSGITFGEKSGTVHKIGKPGDEGAYSANRNFQGLLDELSIYSYALTGAEVQQLYSDTIEVP